MALYDSINKFINNATTIKPQVPAANMPVAPKTSVLASNTSATSTKPTVIKTPAAQQYISSISKPSTFTIDTSRPSPTMQNGVMTTSGTTTPNPTTGSSQSTAGSPTTTPPSTTGPSATDTAFSEYIKSLQPSESLTKAKTAYNDYVANANLGIKNLEGQGRGIPLGLVRGQQAKLADQAEIEAKRLQGDIGIAQEEQQNLQQVGKAGLDYALNRESIKTAAEKQAYDRLTNEQKTKFDQELATKKLAQDTLEANRKFEEDKRQFGLEYALKAKEVAIAQQKANQDNPNSVTNTTAKDIEATNTMNLVNTLLQNKNLNDITGSFEQYRPSVLLGEGANLAKNQYNQVKSMLSLENRGKLKGQGAVSDFEGRVLENAASSLGRNLSTSDFTKQLKQIRGAIATSHGQNADVLLTDPKSGRSQVVTSNSAMIAQAIKDGLIAEYQ